jgi:type IV pilus assembly protein PilW
VLANRERGFHLPELMIALALSLVLLAAFVSVLQRCRASLAANESLARLQDGARHALSVLVPDIEHAGFYGFTSHAMATVVGPLPSGAGDCGSGFALNLGAPVQGSDNSFAFGSAARNCAPAATAGGAHGGSDTLTVRHASQDVVAPNAGRVQVYSQALAAAGPLLLFADGRAPGPVDANHVVRDLEVRSYYIANNSVERPGWPALRVKALTEAAGAAQFRDEEILTGVEDLQIEFIVARADTGVVRVGYVAPGLPLAVDDRVVAVRLWLRICADVTEPGYQDDSELNYANVHFTPSPTEARQRRMLIERTVALRNLSP